MQRTGKQNRKFIGADPDMHSQSFVMVDEANKLRRIIQIKISSKLTGREAICAMADQVSHLESGSIPWCTAAAVESQEIAYTTKQGANPRSLLLLANVSGILLTKLYGRCPHVSLPTPQAWKGSIPKKIHQARICKRMGWDYTERSGYVVPSVDLRDVDIIGKITSSDWKHILDSVGLALWAREMFLKQERREKVLEDIRHEQNRDQRLLGR